MKKIISFIIFLFLCVEAFVGGCILFTKEARVNAEINKQFENTEELKEVTFSYDSFRIHKGLIRTEKSFETKVNVEYYELIVEDISLFEIGDTFQKGDNVGGVDFACRSKIIDIKGNTLTLMNLENSSFVFYLSLDNKVYSNTELEFSLRVGKKKYEVISYQKSFDMDKQKFEITAYFENDGYVLSGMTGYVVYTKDVIVNEEQIYIPAEYVIFGEEKTYVFKLIKKNKNTYYEEVEVEIVDTYENYLIVLGELQDENVIIFPR